jgi:hypothetical protein
MVTSTMGYLYDDMDRAKEAIHWYYEDKGEEGFTKQAHIWSLNNERWNNALHHPIHPTTLYLNPVFSYSCGFIFDVEGMDGFLQYVHRMVLTTIEHSLSPARGHRFGRFGLLQLSLPIRGHRFGRLGSLQPLSPANANYNVPKKLNVL